MNWGKGEFNYATPSPRNQQQNQLHLGELISLNENRVILTEGNKIYYHCYPGSDSETCLFSRCRVLFSFFFFSDSHFTACICVYLHSYSGNFINPKKFIFVCSLPKQATHTVKLTQPTVFEHQSQCVHIFMQPQENKL